MAGIRRTNAAPQADKCGATGGQMRRHRRTNAAPQADRCGATGGQMRRQRRTDAVGIRPASLLLFFAKKK